MSKFQKSNLRENDSCNDCEMRILQISRNFLLSTISVYFRKRSRVVMGRRQTWAPFSVFSTWDYCFITIKVRSCTEQNRFVHLTVNFGISDLQSIKKLDIFRLRFVLDMGRLLNMKLRYLRKHYQLQLYCNKPVWQRVILFRGTRTG